MKKYRNKILFGISYAMLLVLATGISIMSVNKSYSKENIDYIGGLPVDYAHAIYAYDTSTPENTAMASKYIFIAKVNKVLRTEYWNPVEVDENTTTTLYDPFTVYSIDVIKNIKGELITSESIELMQYGGINKEGDSYTFREGGGLLNEGEYYIILTGSMSDGSLEVSNPNRIIPLGKLRGIFNSNEIDNIIETREGLTSNENNILNIIEVYESAAETNMNRPLGQDIPILDNISKYDINY